MRQTRIKWQPVGWWLGWLLAGTLVACQTATPAPAPTPTATRPLPPRYVPPTPTETPTPPSWPTGTPALPTPTPLYYTIQEGDTLLGLALRFGIPLEALKQANPNLNPEAMPVGATVVIPLDPTYMPQLPTPTPPSWLVLGPVTCYPEGMGGAWCFSLVRNLGPQARLHVAAQLQVLSWGQEATPYVRQALLTSLALALPPGRTLPLVAYLDPPWAERWQARASLWRALPLTNQAWEQRFAPVEMAYQVVEQGPASLWARVVVSWQVEPPASWVRLVLWGLDSRGWVAGARAWTWEGPWMENTAQEVEVLLYSAGPPLVEVHAYIEAVRLPQEGNP